MEQIRSFRIISTSSLDIRKFPDSQIEIRHLPEWQPLETHLKNVAEMARGFAEAFGAREWGLLASLWHDLGKMLPSISGIGENNHV